MRTRAMYSPDVRDFLSKRRQAEPPPLPKPAPKAIPEPLNPSHRYLACEDVLFPGTWRVEPVSYVGVGIVYLFRGLEARVDAKAFANRKNAVADKKRKEDTRK